MNRPVDLRAGTAAARLADFERYQVTDRLAIASLLRTVMERRILVSVNFGGGRTYLSTLIFADPDYDEIVVDCTRSPETDADVLAARRITLAMAVDHIPVQFHAAGIRKVNYQGARAFAIAFPEAVIRMQRREYYRVVLPRKEDAYLELRTEPNDPWPMRLRVHDIGCGGVGLDGWEEGRAPESKRIYKNCRMNLGGEAEIVTDVEIVYVIEQALDGTPTKRAGARFVEMPGMQVTTIQRYITGLERRIHAEELALKGD